MLTSRKTVDEFTRFVLNNRELRLAPADAMLFLVLFARFVKVKTVNGHAAEIPFLGTFKRKEDGGMDFTPCDDLFEY